MKQTELDGWDFMLWRPVMLEKAHKWELDQVWSFDDLITFLEIQDIQDEVEKQEYNNQSKR